VNNPTADVLVADARRAVHESLILLPAWEADRVRALIADLETAVESRTAIQCAAPSVGQAPATAQTDDDAELTAEEARDLAAQLGLDLYRAQDALAFVGECCDIADREGRPVTTADVREWLKGARCGRQLMADAAERNDLRDRIAEVLWPLTDWDGDELNAERAADAVLAVLPAPTDRASVLAEHLVERCPDHGCVEPAWEDGCHCEIEPLLRRLAGEAATPEHDTEARPVIDTASDTPQHAAATVLHCSSANFLHKHGPHGWEPQPGMDPVHCPGYAEPAVGAQQPKEA
jgi:hypothetical protein